MFARLMGLPVISPRALHAQLQSGRVHVLDVNARSSWLSARIPGALHADPRAFVAEDLPQDRDATLVFYCSGPLCRKAPNAARRARQLGHRDVLVLSAGISGWLAASLPTESGEAVMSDR